MNDEALRAEYEAAKRSLPRWNEEGPDVDTRYAHAVARITALAEAGYLPAIEDLAGGQGGPRTFEWAIELAERGDVQALVMQLSSHDWPPESCLAVLERARGGTPWAALAIGELYGLGMADAATDELVCTKDGAFGFLPGVADPSKEARRWIQAAADARHAPAMLSLAFDLEDDDPEGALRLLRDALESAAQLPPISIRRAKNLLRRLLDAVDAPLEEQWSFHEGLAAEGDDESMTWLAERFRLGEGTAQDLVEARRRYEHPAQLGNVDACRELGTMCELGHGGPVDLEKARALYERAAELGGDEFSRRRLVETFGLDWYAS